MAWMDNTGLYQKYGTEQTVTSTGGEYRNNGALREIEIKLDLVALNQNEVIQNDNLFVPAGVKIQEVEIFVETAAATGVAVDVGLTRTDRTTEIDFDGLVAALATASLTAGSTIVLRKGSTGAGALVGSGTALTNIGMISASATTATAFTTGLLKIRIRYERP